MSVRARARACEGVAQRGTLPLQRPDACLQLCQPPRAPRATACACLRGSASVARRPERRPLAPPPRDGRRAAAHLPRGRRCAARVRVSAARRCILHPRGQRTPRGRALPARAVAVLAPEVALLERGVVLEGGHARA